MKDIKLSSYQQKLIDFALHSQGNALINAYAGSGKSFTLIQLMKVLPKESTKLYCAFNKNIVTDIENKTTDIDNLLIKTIHSIGFSIIFHKEKCIVDENKYTTFIHNEINKISEIYENLTYNQKSKFKANVKRLIDFSRNNLCDGEKCIRNIADKFGIPIIGDEIQCVVKALKWGKENINTIDYGDMVWIPNVLPFKFPHYDYVFVDEIQDLSVAQQEIVKKCRNGKTRFFYAGDKYQSIYAFAGADSDSFDNFTKLPNIQQFSLPICYRCGDKIIDLASQTVNGIKHDETNNHDDIIEYDAKIESIKDGDAVLCRNNAPLMKLYFTFLNNGIKSHILGKDIGQNLIELIKETEQEKLSLSLKEDGVFPRLYDKLIEIKNNIKRFEMCDDITAISSIQFKNFYDKIQTLEIVSEKCNTASELINRINLIFEDDEQNGIVLSTIHKAKGLEWNNVNILCKSLFAENIKRSDKKWEKDQEINLNYVSITRAKKILRFIEDSTFAKYTNSINTEEIKQIENAITTIYGTNQYDLTNKYEIFKPIVDKIKPSNIVNLKNVDTNKQCIKNLTKIIKKRKIC